MLNSIQDYEKKESLYDHTNNNHTSTLKMIETMDKIEDDIIKTNRLRMIIVCAIVGVLMIIFGSIICIKLFDIRHELKELKKETIEINNEIIHNKYHSNQVHTTN